MPSEHLTALRPSQRFHLRITLLYSLGVVVVLTAAALFAWKVSERAALHAMRDRIATTAYALSLGVNPDALERAVASAGPDKLRDRLSRDLAALPDPSLSSAYILLYDEDPKNYVFFVDWARDGDNAAPGERYDGTGLTFLQRGFFEASTEDRLYRDAYGWSLSTYVPIRRPGGPPLALLGLDVEAAWVSQLRWQLLLITGGAWLLALAATGVASYLVGRNVREPLTRVIDATAAIADGEFGVRLHLDRADEFGVMARLFDRMAEGLEERERIRDMFGRFVDPDVARAILASAPELGGQVRRVSVVLTDLRGYSTIGEVLPPGELVALLNRWLAEMQQVLDQSGGTVIEIMGDSIVAVFGAPSDQPDHADRAMRCVIAMRERMAALSAAVEPTPTGAALRQIGLAGLSQRVGVHTGDAVAGHIGSLTRMKYAVVGDTVNVAARLEQLNKALGTDVLISADTRAALSEAFLATSGARFRSHGERPVKGRERVVEVWELVANELPVEKSVVLSAGE